jgi:arginine/ornithine transport system substrate-binding protein
MTSRRLFLTLLAATTAVAALPRLGLAQAGAKKLRIAIEGAYPPFSEVGPDGKLSGFDVDIAQALCTQMGVECQLVQQAWDGMIPGLNARKFDAVLSSMSITDERRKSVNFTNRYYSTPARLVARAGSTLDGSPAKMKGKRVGVQRSTSHDRYASEQFAGAEVVRYTGQDEVFLDLAAGRLDATLCDSVAADVGFLKRPAGKGFAFTGPLFTDDKYFGYGAGIALRKADVELQQRLNAAITALRANGRYKAIQDKYFGFDVYGTDK